MRYVVLVGTTRGQTWRTRSIAPKSLTLCVCLLWGVSNVTKVMHFKMVFVFRIPGLHLYTSKPFLITKYSRSNWLAVFLVVLFLTS